MTVREQFENLHAAHPDVYEELVKLATDVRGRGYVRSGSLLVRGPSLTSVNIGAWEGSYNRQT